MVPSFLLFPLCDGRSPCQKNRKTSKKRINTKLIPNFEINWKHYLLSPPCLYALLFRSSLSYGLVNKVRHTQQLLYDWKRFRKCKRTKWYNKYALVRFLNLLHIKINCLSVSLITSVNGKKNNQMIKINEKTRVD